ncbi:hypothetical protein ACFSQJ_06740 [Croceitalea marina]|uniref:Uncharacterized protein n=1 Tax=Croceitalea marina TaxID=1775166 RepID=A0ABW5MW68_9FLAO
MYNIIKSKNKVFAYVIYEYSIRQLIRISIVTKPLFSLPIIKAADYGVFRTTHEGSEG